MRKDNRGSSFIMVLIIVSFIAILATVSIMTAMLNLKMKTVDKESKKTFYTAEEAIDEIYAGLGKLSMEKLDIAYQDQLSTMIRNTSVNNIQMSGNVDNISANIELRKNFTNSMLLTLIGQPDTAKIWNYEQSDFDSETYKGAFQQSLNKFLEDPSKSSVKKLEKVYIEKTQGAGGGLPVYRIHFTGCNVTYEKEDGYYADVTFDGSVALPDITVRFTAEGKNILDTFKNYSLIGNLGVRINAGKQVKLSQNLYAGVNGLKLALGSSLQAVDSTIVTSQDIQLSGANFLVKGESSIWATNMLADETGKSTVTINTTCKTYMKDDLTLDGDQSFAKVSGDYYGYSYEGNGGNTPDGHAFSSSVIVNGKNAVLDMNDIATLVLGGRAYIDYQNGSGDTYMTGESLALKGDQEAYLVPSSYIINATTQKSQSNPLSPEAFKNTEVGISRDNFFGYSLLDTENPYTTVNSNGQIYVYFKFASKQASASYMKAILNDTAFDELCGGVERGTTKYHAYQESRNYMKNILQINMEQLVQTSIISKSDTNAKIYANGTLIHADPGTETVSDVAKGAYQVGDSYNEDAFALNALDLKNRYTLISKMLYTPSMYQMNQGSVVKDARGNPVRNIYTDITNSVLDNGKVIDIRGYTESVFANFINTSFLSSNASYNNKIGSNIIYATTGNLTLNQADYDGGVIIAQGDVEVKRNFNGIIIAGGTIHIDEDAVITNKISGYSDLIEFLNQCPEEFKKYFKYWNPVMTDSGAGGQKITSISGITYKDIVLFSNWFKDSGK